MKEDKNIKCKYVVNIVFDKKYESFIREAAAEKDLPVATFIKQCVLKEAKKKKNKQND